MNKSCSIGAFCAAAFMTIAAVPAHAVTTTTQLQTFSAPPNATVSFDFFDASLGTLTGVNFAIQSTVTNTIEGDFYISTQSTGQPTIRSDIVFGVLSTTIGNGGNSVLGASVTCNLQNSGCTFFPKTLSVDRSSSDFLSYFGLSPGLGNFVGAGIFDVELSVIQVATGDCSLTAYATCSLSNLDWSGSLTLSYDYTPSPVPVPAAVWLFGSGLLGLIGIARRKKAA